jgi:ABC-type multidrug transport system fused ATPase/permease subunit
MLQVQEGTGEAMGALVQYLAMVVGGLVIAYTASWSMALIVTAAMLVFVALTRRLNRALARLDGQAQAERAHASAVATEVLVGLPTVVAYGAQAHERERFDAPSRRAWHIMARRGLAAGIGSGTAMLLLFAAYAGAFYYGAVLVSNNIISPGNVATTFLGRVCPQ